MPRRFPPLAPMRPRRAGSHSNRLKRLEDFGSNPGQLAAWAFVPDVPEDPAVPLVVVLHGCTQTAAAYDVGSGWSELAESSEFAVLFPEQQRLNNANLCFNWFEPADTQRDAGEALSIAQMVAAMIARYGVDRERIFITGLSAGGAMSAVMLASYPDVFAGGAILAGLPHGAAASAQQAFQQMHSPSPTRQSGGSSIRQAVKHRGSWPKVSVWHGTADTVVNPSNADAIVRQWLEVHEIARTRPEEDSVEGHTHRTWRNAAGEVLVEEYRIGGMGHGAPLATTGDCGCGEAGAFMLEAGISSTVQSAKSWGLLTNHRKTASPRKVARGQNDNVVPPPSNLPLSELGRGTDGISRVIEDALRTAGLMK